VRQEAERLGITVTQNDIDDQVQQLFFFDLGQETTTSDPDAEATAEATADPASPTPFVSATPSPAPTATATLEVTAEIEPTVTFTPFPTIEPIPTRSYEERVADFDENLETFYERASAEANMSQEEVDAYIETLALRAALTDIVVEGGTTSTWADARHILVQTEEEARDIIDALNRGESFADLAQANSIDTGSAAQGGELDWQDTANYVPEFAEVVRNLPIGAISEPVQSDYGFHIIQVRAREDRELSEAVSDANRQQEFEEWLTTLRSREETEYEINDIWLDNVPTTPLYSPR
jgi:parvulin-like peptidyl-prolyl isomerase